MKKIVVVGCGPKAIAIAAKAHVLKKLGWKVPEVVIIDKHGPASNWDGTNGYTDGDTILGTTPLEDVGFPYESLIDTSVDQEMLKLSYMAYQIELGKYAEWVDRGLPSPSHAKYAEYMKWVFGKTDLTCTVGEVTTISHTANRWHVSYNDGSSDAQIDADALVLTGPGKPHRFPRSGHSDAEERILNGQNIWHNLDRLRDARNAIIAVIGAGETSAGIVTGLLGVVGKSSRLEIVTRHPILFTRNEHWMEVMYFSKVMNWGELSDKQKREVIRHADRGTFSVAAKNLLDSAYNVSTRLGSVSKIESADNKLYLISKGDEETRIGPYDYVIEATGFDQLSFLELFPDQTLFESPNSLHERIETDMGVSGLSPRLHLPNLAAMTQGPGFPNLSCLGLLADRILMSYITK